MSQITVSNYSFPPVDDLISKLSKVNYQKLYQQFVTAVLFVGAVFVVVYSKFMEWYRNGGSEAIVNKTKVLLDFINSKTKIVDKIYILLVKFHNWIENVAHRVSDLTV